MKTKICVSRADTGEEIQCQIQQYTLGIFEGPRFYSSHRTFVRVRKYGGHFEQFL
jgi:hypothetical protein